MVRVFPTYGRGTALTASRGCLLVCAVIVAAATTPFDLAGVPAVGVALLTLVAVGAAFRSPSGRWQ